MLQWLSRFLKLNCFVVRRLCKVVFFPNGINFSPISKDPHKASSVFISSIKEKLLCDREFQDDVVHQPSAVKSEVSDTVDKIKGRVVMNEMSR